MKQLLFLLLFPCLALAQYQGNANQKITLGEQTTADGLVFRGVAYIDTVTATSKITRANKQDTSAYILLDTVTNLLWHYKTASNGWIQAGGSTLDTATMLLPYWRSGRFSGTLPVANGGTGADMSSLPNNYLIRKNSSGVFDTSSVYEAGGKVGIGLIPDIKLHIASPIGSDFLQYTEDETYKTPRFGVQVTSGFGKLLFNSYNIPMYLSSGKAGGTGGIVAIQTGVLGSEVERFRINEDGKVGIGTDNPNATLEVYKSSASVVDAAKFGGNFGYATFNNYGDLLGTYATTVSILTAAFTTNTAGFGTQSNSDLAIFTNSQRRATVKNTGEFGIGTASPTARLHLAAGTASASSAPLKFTSGTNLTTAEAGVMEFNGTNLFFSPSTTRHTVNHGLTGSATLDFPSTTTLLSADLTITVTGAADGDVVSLGVPNAAVNANTCYTAWVSAANTVTVRFNNYSSGTVNPASGSFKVFVTK